MKKILTKYWKVAALIIFVVIVSGIPHAINMFKYPYYENDEGTYMSQAWSLLNFGKLAPYTYWYDHSPFGWMLIALWVKLTGGFFTFGMSINSGRVMMLILHILSSISLFHIANKLTKSYMAGILAILIFSFSPLAIYFQRRVLLDNIMVFWFLLSWATLMRDKISIKYSLLAGIFFGIAVLTKENAIFFLPGFVYLIYSNFTEKTRNIGIVIFLTSCISVISVYFLYAYLKKELLPVGFLGDFSPHVSLLETLKMQASRGNKLPFWNLGSDFFISFNNWFMKDKFIIIFGSIATVFITTISVFKKEMRVPIFFSLLFALFLLRGGLIINFYIVPMIPLFALNIGLFLFYFSKFLSRNSTYIFYLLVVILSTIVLQPIISSAKSVWQNDETSPQVEAYSWIYKNVDSNSKIVIDCYPYVDLHEPHFKGDKIFANADWFWKYSFDPEIKNKFGNDWRNVNYILLTHEMVKQIGYAKVNDPLRMVYDNSQKRVMYGPVSNTFVDLDKYISTNGDWAGVLELPSKKTLSLDTSWQFYKANFIKPDGQVIDPSNERTTSEGQSYALLRSVWMDDKESFDIVWNWTKTHIQNRDDHLFSWIYAKDVGTEYKVLDNNSASDADEDIALALIFASERWTDSSYLRDSINIIKDIWDKEVINIGGRDYLGFSADPMRNDGVIVNPSYLSPASYRIFALIDNEHPWQKLAEDSYYLLNKITENNDLHLPTNFIYISKNGTLKSASEWFGDKSDFYGFDAFRTLFRVALDAEWFNNPDANMFIQKISPFFVNKWENNKKFAAEYSVDGNIYSEYSSLSTSSGALATLYINNIKLGNMLYKNLIEKNYNTDGYWGEKNNYYDQNWSWFITALYSEKLPNIYSGNSVEK